MRNSIMEFELERDKRVATICNRVQGPRSDTMSSRCSTASYTPRMTYDRQSLQPEKRAMHAQKKNKGEGASNSHLEDPVCLNGINPQTRIFPAPDDIPPIPNRARARPQRGVRPEHGAEGRGRLQALGRVDVLENFARYGEVVLYRLLIRCISHIRLSV